VPHLSHNFYKKHSTSIRIDSLHQLNDLQREIGSWTGTRRGHNGLIGNNTLILKGRGISEDTGMRHYTHSHKTNEEVNPDGKIR